MAVSVQGSVGEEEKIAPPPFVFLPRHHRSLQPSSQRIIFEPEVRAFRATDAQAYAAQKKGPVLGPEFPSLPYRTQRPVKVEDTYTLVLGPSECFFSPPGKMRANRSGPSKDTLNQNKTFNYIRNFCRKGDRVVWPIWIPGAAGSVDLDLRLQAGSSRQQVFDLIFDDGKVSKSFSTNAGGAEEYAASCSIYGLEPGFHTVELGVKSANVVKLWGMVLHSTIPISVVRERWRPLATHIGFAASEAKEVVSGWVGQIQQVRNEGLSLGAFSPYTTPFGYYGPVLKADGKASGINFSFWSYGRGQPRPEDHRLSKIVAIGSSGKGVRFGRFDHEGHGVKIRGFNAFKDNTSKVYVTHLRFRLVDKVKDGFVYAFQSWFWDENEQAALPDNKGNEDGNRGSGQKLGPEAIADMEADQEENVDPFADPEEMEQGWESEALFDPEQDDHDVLPGRWRLYGVGFKFRSKPLNSLFMRSFIEVPGVAERQRTNHVARQVGYRGFMRSGKEWYHVDSMSGSAGRVAFTNKRWNSVERGQDVDYDFLCSCGGLEQSKEKKVSRRAEPLEEHNLPLYMKRIGQTEVHIPYPTVVGHQIKDPGTAGEEGNKVTLLRINVPQTVPSFHKVGAPVRIEIYYGKRDGMCLEEEWDAHTSVGGTLAGGISDVEIPPIPAKYSIRVLVVYSNLQVWSLVPYVPIEGED